MNPRPSLHGSCLCGAVRFEADLPLRWFQYCHCISCRKTTSSAHAAHLFLPPEQFRWVSGEENIQRFIDEKDNPGYKRFFCKTCGSSVPRLNRTEEWMVVQAGLLDGEPPTRPERNIFWSDRAPWFTDVDALPKFSEGGDSSLLEEAGFPAAHRKFSKECSNAAWKIIDQAERTEEETLRMLDLAHSSMWHWTKREDATQENMAIGCWQLARVYALAGLPDAARRYAQRSLDLTPADDFFHRGFAHEALARAEMTAGNHEAMERHLAEARHLSAGIPDKDNAAWLVKNLEDIA